MMIKNKGYLIPITAMILPVVQHMAISGINTKIMPFI